MQKVDDRFAPHLGVNLAGIISCDNFFAVGLGAGSAVGPIRPQSTPSRGPIPKTHHVLHPWTRPTYDAKRHPGPIHHFTARRYASAVLAVIVCLSVHLSVCLSQVGVVQRWLNLGSD